MKRACVAVVDAAHARFFSYARGVDSRSTLEELFDHVSAGRREVIDPHDDSAVREERFARETIDRIVRRVSEHSFRRVILVATPKMLARLRQKIEPVRRTGVSIEEIPQDLMRLSLPQVHDHLARLPLIEPRPSELRAR